MYTAQWKDHIISYHIYFSGGESDENDNIVIVITDVHRGKYDHTCHKPGGNGMMIIVTMIIMLTI